MTTEPTDFVRLSPAKGGAPVRSPITISTISIRDAEPKISLSFSAEDFARFGGGCDRFKAEWSPSTFILRLEAEQDGPFEATRSRGTRRLLRVPLPSGVQHVDGITEPAPHRLMTGEPVIFITVPPAFRIAGTPDRREAAADASA